MTRMPGIIASCSAVLVTVFSATAQTTFDHSRATAITTPAGAVGGELLTEGFPGPPTVAITNAMIGLQPGDDIDALSFGDDVQIAGFHQIIFSVDPKIPAFPVTGTGVAFENSVDTPPGIPPAACGDLFLQIQTGPGICSNVLAPGGLGYFTGTSNGDEANAAWATPGVVGLADDLDAFDFSPPATALNTGIYFSLAPGSPSLAMIPATPGDILYSPLGGGPVTIATLAGAGPATDVNLGIPGRDLDALNLVAQSPGVIAAGAVGPTPCNPMGCPSGCTHLLEFSIAKFVSPFVFLPGDVLGVAGPGVAAPIVNAGLLGLCSNPLACGAFGDLDNLNALEVGVPVLPTVGTTFDHNHAMAITPAGVAGDLLTEGFPGAPTVSIPLFMIGLVQGDDIDALSFGDDFLIAQPHTIIFSVDSISVGQPVSGVNTEFNAGTPPSLPLPGPNPPEACGDLFNQVFVGPGLCLNTVAPAGLGYAAGAGTGDEFNATWASPNFFGLADDLDAFDYSPAATALTTGIYFSLAPGSPSLGSIPATPGDILYSPLAGLGSVTIATLAGAGLATDVMLGIADQDLDALNCIAVAPGVIALGPIGPTPCSPGGGSHLIEFSISYTAMPGVPFFPADVLGVFGAGAAGVLTPAIGLGLCTPPFCPNNDQLDNLNALEDPSGIELPCPWDLDGDGFVGIVDFLNLLAQWGTNPGGPPDFDNDGNVGITDFLKLLAHWGECP